MTAHDLALARTAHAAAQSPRAVAHPLNALDLTALSKRLMIFTPAGQEVSALLDRARPHITGLTSNDIFHRVISHNPDAFWAISRRSRFDLNAPKGEGFLAFLMLTEEGVRKLLDGSLDTKNPRLEYITRQSEKPAGIYVWAIHAQGLIAAGIPLVLQKVSTPLYVDCDLYARAVTVDGFRILETLGFRRGAEFQDLLCANLHMFHRNAAAERGAGMRERDRHSKTTVRLARTMEDVARAFAIRGAVYIGEQLCPYDEEYDGTILPPRILLDIAAMNHQAAFASDILRTLQKLSDLQSEVRPGDLA